MSRIVLFSVLLAVFIRASAAHNSRAQQQSLPNDRWTWLELYWVDHDHIPQSVSTYLYIAS